MELPFSTSQLLVIASPIGLSLTILLICLTIPYFNFTFSNDNPTRKPIPTRLVNINPTDLTARELHPYEKLRCYEKKLKKMGAKNWTLKDDEDMEETVQEFEKILGERFVHIKERVIFTVSDKNLLEPAIERMVLELLIREVLGLVVIGGRFYGFVFGVGLGSYLDPLGCDLNVVDDGWSCGGWYKD